MEINRLKKLAGLNESDTLAAELKQAEVERTADNGEKPSFKGLLSGETPDSEGFSFLKSIRNKPIEEADPMDNGDNGKNDDSWEAAHQYFDDAVGFEHVKTEEGKKEIFNNFLTYMHDMMVNPLQETSTLQDWADAFTASWDVYLDKVFQEHNVEYTHDDDRNTSFHHYADMNIDNYYKNFFAEEFAKWALANEAVIKQDGFSSFPDVTPGDFAAKVAPKINESIEPATETEENIEEISEDLYNEIINAGVNSNIQEKGIKVGYVMESLNISKTSKNIALVESIILKK